MRNQFVSHPPPPVDQGVEDAEKRRIQETAVFALRASAVAFSSYGETPAFAVGYGEARDAVPREEE